MRLSLARQKGAERQKADRPREAERDKKTGETKEG